MNRRLFFRGLAGLLSLPLLNRLPKPRAVLPQVPVPLNKFMFPAIRNMATYDLNEIRSVKPITEPLSGPWSKDFYMEFVREAKVADPKTRA